MSQKRTAPQAPFNFLSQAPTNATQFKMKRNPRKLKWTKAFRRAAGKEMTVDSTLSFAARRNIPVRYDRNLVASTIKAMDRVSEIKARREKVFHKQRMAGNKERVRQENARLVAEQGHLLPRERASVRRERERMDVDAEGAMVGEEVMEDLEEELSEEEEVVKQKSKDKQKAKQRLLVGGGVEDRMQMD